MPIVSTMQFRDLESSLNLADDMGLYEVFVHAPGLCMRSLNISLDLVFEADATTWTKFDCH